MFVETERFDNIKLSVIISGVSKFFEFCTTLLTLLMMTGEAMLSKRPILSITVI